MDEKLTIIVPVLNEKKNIDNLFENFSKFSNEMFSSYRVYVHVIFVDDGSVDGTSEKVEENFLHYRMKGALIKLRRNFGKDKAIIAALHNFESDYYVIVDADLQTPLQVISEMFTLIKKNDVEIVRAVKENEPYGIFRKMLTNLFFKVADILRINEFKKGSSDFLMFKKIVRDHVINLREKEFLLRAIIAWFGFRDGVVYFTPSKSRFTKFPLRKLFSIGIKGIVTFSNFLSVNFIIALVYWVISIFYGAIIIRNKIKGVIVTGLSSTLLLMLISFGLLFFMLAVFGVILKIIFEEVKDRPLFLIEKIEEFNKN